MANTAKSSAHHLSTLPSDVVTCSSTRDAYSMLNKYRTRIDSRAFIAIALDYAIWIAAICVSELVSELLPQKHLAARLAYVASVLVIASRLRAFENLVHEASHHNLFQNAEEHQKWQFLYAFPVFKLLEDYRTSHLEHHKHLGDPNKDPDMQRIQDLGLDKLQERPLWLLCGLPLTGYLTFEWLRDSFLTFWFSRAAVLPKITYWLLAASLVYTADCASLVLSYYVVPLLVILPVSRYWAEAAEHVGLDMNSSYGHSRSNLGLVHKWYLNPHYDGYHTVHHIHSQVPFHALETAHGALTAGHEHYRHDAVVSMGGVETVWQMLQHRTVWKEDAREHAKALTRTIAV